jgi:MFS family permease
MWRLGFFFHEMAFGLLSIFLPLYIMSLAVNNGLFYVGLMSAFALFLAIPASFFWGYLCDKTRRYKRYILLSFLTSAVFLGLFTLTTNVGLLIVLYAAMSVLHMAHEAPKNVLIAETYSREDWDKTFALYEGFTEVGWLIGLLLGFFMSAWRLGAVNTLLVCGSLNLVAFAISLVFVTDPLLVFERGLVSIEKTVDFAFHGVSLASRLLDGASVNSRLKKQNVTAFCGGLVLFSLATSILFTPMPIFVSNIARNDSVVFAIFVLNSCGGVAGYALAGSRSKESKGHVHIGRTVAFRSLLALLLIATLQISAYRVELATAILMLMGFAYAIFLVYTLSLSMELIPAGKAGLFNVLIGIGGACGSFVGPLIAQAFGFFYVFIVSGGMFFSAYVAFRIFG